MQSFLWVIRFFIQTNIISLIREMYTRKGPEYQSVTGESWGQTLLIQFNTVK